MPNFEKRVLPTTKAPNLSASTDVFRAVADPTRRAILDMLAEGELAVKELHVRFPISQPALSQHLKVLRAAGLVSGHRTGRLRIYRLNARPLADVRGWLMRYERFWDDRLRRLRHLLDGVQDKDGGGHEEH